MAYCDYPYYRDNFHGKMSEADFAFHAESASDYIDSVTFGRITADILADEILAKKIKRACCACADIYADVSVSSKIASETVGSHSVTYAAAGNSAESEKRLFSSVKMYLADTGLMYRGVYE